jgi:hypothetical protein
MTPAQEAEMQRFTPNMWELLRYAEQHHPHEAEVGASSYMRALRIMERRGFIAVIGPADPGFYKVKLTQAGFEALAR